MRQAFSIKGKFHSTRWVGAALARPRGQPPPHLVRRPINPMPEPMDQYNNLTNYHSGILFSRRKSIEYANIPPTRYVCSSDPFQTSFRSAIPGTVGHVDGLTGPLRQATPTSFVTRPPALYPAFIACPFGPR
jgi:hypothetical protein